MMEGFQKEARLTESQGFGLVDDRAGEPHEQRYQVEDALQMIKKT